MRAALLAIVLAGCYQPVLTDGLPCSESHDCPDGQSCVPGQNICLADAPTQAHYAQISAGDTHTCAIDSAHRLYCWGLDAIGQVGQPASLSIGTPTQVGTDSDWGEVFASFGETCAIKQNGSLWCFGGFTSMSQPLQVMPGQTFTSVTLGDFGWCAIDGSGTAWCGIDVNLSPINSDTSWTSFATTGYTWCGVRGGHLYCWGDDEYGQIGNGMVAPQEQPVTAEYEPAPQHTWKQVTIGFEHACAITADDDSSPDTVWCWGSDEVGQAGVVSDGPVLTPTQVSGLAGATAISSMWFTTCADTASGTYCWGEGIDGEIGGGPADESNVAPIAIGGSLAQVSVGGDHACGLGADGGAWCWGANDSGQLGTGAAGAMIEPTHVDADDAWTKISIGYRHSCGIDGGDLWCWGRNGHGQLGDGTTVQRATPVRVEGATGWTDVAAGLDHTCGIAGGQMYCWGNNAAGELGTGDRTDRAVPTIVGDKTDWQRVAVGRELTCAVDSATALYCWGEANATRPIVVPGSGTGWSDPDGSPELDEQRVTAIHDGAVEIVDSFTIVDPSTTFTDWTLFDDAAEHGCGLRGGIMFCQGVSNRWGELGDDNMQPNPQQGWQVGAATDWTDAAAGTNFSCGLEGDALSCWGRDDLGQLGDGRTDVKQLLPKPSTKPTGWTDIAAGAATACGIQSDHSLWCWGEDQGLHGGWDTPVWVVTPP